MYDTQLQKRGSWSIKEKGQYVLAFAVVASMLLVAGFPVFVIFFFGIFAYFLLRMFSSGSRSETREIFEFYLAANEILREDDRRWYGFEIHEAIARGESIVRSMPASPPLVSFTLGALFHKLEDHASAVRYLAAVLDEDAPKESAIVYPSRELREYVRMLRRIERSPAEAPLTSAAVRALERARRNRGKKLLAESRELAGNPPIEARPVAEIEAAPPGEMHRTTAEMIADETAAPPRRTSVAAADPKTNGSSSERPDRKTISEVLHDIYEDGNIQ